MSYLARPADRHNALAARTVASEEPGTRPCSMSMFLAKSGTYQLVMASTGCVVQLLCNTMSNELAYDCQNANYLLRDIVKVHAGPPSETASGHHVNDLAQ